MTGRFHYCARRYGSCLCACVLVFACVHVSLRLCAYTGTSVKVFVLLVLLLVYRRPFFNFSLSLAQIIDQLQKGGATAAEAKRRVLTERQNAAASAASGSAGGKRKFATPFKYVSIANKRPRTKLCYCLLSFFIYVFFALFFFPTVIVFPLFVLVFVSSHHFAFCVIIFLVPLFDLGRMNYRRPRLHPRKCWLLQLT